MASKHKPVSVETKLEALEEIDKKLNLRIKLLKTICSVALIHGKIPGNTRNKTRLF